MIKTFLAAFGFVFAAAYLGGALGIGHFYVYYGKEPVQCIKGTP